jgi:hypothetical protein
MKFNPQRIIKDSYPMLEAWSSIWFGRMYGKVEEQKDMSTEVKGPDGKVLATVRVFLGFCPGFRPERVTFVATAEYQAKVDAERAAEEALAKAEAQARIDAAYEAV